MTGHSMDVRRSETGRGQRGGECRNETKGKVIDGRSPRQNGKHEVMMVQSESCHQMRRRWGWVDSGGDSDS